MDVFTHVLFISLKTTPFTFALSLLFSGAKITKKRKQTAPPASPKGRRKEKG